MKILFKSTAIEKRMNFLQKETHDFKDEVPIKEEKTTSKTLGDMRTEYSRVTKALNERSKVEMQDNANNDLIDILGLEAEFLNGRDFKNATDEEIEAIVNFGLLGWQLSPKLNVLRNEKNPALYLAFVEAFKYVRNADKNNEIPTKREFQDMVNLEINKLGY